MEATVKRWRRDPNYIAVFPIPIGYQELGGNARGLMTTPEMRFLEETIINSLGVPLEFIKGGASWTGSSISLRIVENMFLTYRNLLLDFLNHFLLPKLHHFLGYPKVKIKFKEFKMSDDAQTKQLTLQLAEMGKLSDQKLLDSFGYDPEEVREELASNVHNMTENQVNSQRMQAIGQGESNIILAKYNVRAEMTATREQLKLRLEKLQEEVQKEIGVIPEGYDTYIETMAIQLMYLDPATQIQQIAKLQRQRPTTHGLVMELIQMYGNAGVTPNVPGKPGNPNVKQEAPNEKNPGERAENKVKVEGEKTRGNTRGEPR